MFTNSKCSFTGRQIQLLDGLLLEKISKLHTRQLAGLDRSLPGSALNYHPLVEDFARIGVELSSTPERLEFWQSVVEAELDQLAAVAEIARAQLTKGSSHDCKVFNHPNR